jgi:hypothetical protein
VIDAGTAHHQGAARSRRAHRRGQLEDGVVDHGDVSALSVVIPKSAATFL